MTARPRIFTGQAASATWHADLGKAVIDVPAGLPFAAMSLDYACGSWGSYTLSESPDAVGLDPRTDLQGSLTFVPNERVVYGAFAAISPLTVHVREQQIGGSGGSLEPPGPLS